MINFMSKEMNEFHSTTVVSVRRGSSVAMASDGQVTLGQQASIKHDAKKVRKLKEHGVLVGFAGATADAFSLLEQFEGLLSTHQSNLKKAAIELAKKWRTDKILRRLEAMLAVANSECSLLISGSGDVIEPNDGILAIGSGSLYALSAAKALQENTEMSSREIVVKSLTIAASICVFTNDNITIEEL